MKDREFKAEGWMARRDGGNWRYGVAVSFNIVGLLLGVLLVNGGDWLQSEYVEAGDRSPVYVGVALALFVIFGAGFTYWTAATQNFHLARRRRLVIGATPGLILALIALFSNFLMEMGRSP